MLDKFYIGSYRGLEQIELQDFSDINIFVGANNVGKTSVLEAMVLSGLFDDAQLLIQTLVSRYQRISIDFIKDLFENQNKPLICLKRKMREKPETIHTHITFNEQKKNIISENQMKMQKELILKFQYTLETDESEEDIEKNTSIYAVDFLEEDTGISIRLGKDPENDKKEQKKIPCEFISFSRFDRTSYLIDSLEQVLEQDKRTELLQVLQLFDSQVENFEIIGKERNIKIFSKNNKYPLSLYDYGNGMYKAFYIASAALLCENGILLIDEIEAGIHRKALEQFVKYLLTVCKQRNIQLFLTTHSLETIDLLLENESEYEHIAAYNMRNDEKKIRTRRYSGDKLRELRMDMGLDIR